MKKYSRRIRSDNLSWWLRIGKGKRRVFIFATSLVVAEVAVGGSEWANLGAGLIGAFATLIAAVITVRFQGGRQERKRRDKIKSNNLDFKDISEKNSFSALDVLKVLDLRDSPNPKEDVQGRAVLTDSHLVVREGDAGNGVIFCYATSGSISGASDRNAYEWGEIDPHSSFKQGIPAKSFALGVDLDSLPIGQVARINNRVAYCGAFDDADAESFETHIDRSTPSLTFLILFSPSHPCLSIKGEIDVGRDQWKRAEGNRPVILEGGTVVYWRVFADGGVNSLRHMSKYRLRWTWRHLIETPAGRHPLASLVREPEHEQ